MSRKIFKYLLFKMFDRVVLYFRFRSNLINFENASFVKQSKTKSPLFILYRSNKYLDGFRVRKDVWRMDVFSNPLARYPETLPRAKRGNFVQA